MAVAGTFDPDKSAAPGGGGSGGALLVQAPEVQLAPDPAALAPLSTAVLSTAALSGMDTGPTALSGAQSCWIVPTGGI